MCPGVEYKYLVHRVNGEVEYERGENRVFSGSSHYVEDGRFGETTPAGLQKGARLPFNEFALREWVEDELKKLQQEPGDVKLSQTQADVAIERRCRS